MSAEPEVDLRAGFSEDYVVHYKGDSPCDCGDVHHDPETGLCHGCDPVLYRVVAYPDEWFTDPTLPAVRAVTGRRRLAETIERIIHETRRPVEVYKEAS